MKTIGLLVILLFVSCSKINTTNKLPVLDSQGSSSTLSEDQKLTEAIEKLKVDDLRNNINPATLDQNLLFIKYRDNFQYIHNSSSRYGRATMEIYPWKKRNNKRCNVDLDSIRDERMSGYSLYGSISASTSNHIINNKSYNYQNEIFSLEFNNESATCNKGRTESPEVNITFSKILSQQNRYKEGINYSLETFLDTNLVSYSFVSYNVEDNIHKLVLNTVVSYGGNLKFMIVRQEFIGVHRDIDNEELKKISDVLKIQKPGFQNLISSLANGRRVVSNHLTSRYAKGVWIPINISVNNELKNSFLSMLSAIEITNRHIEELRPDSEANRYRVLQRTLVIRNSNISYSLINSNKMKASFEAASEQVFSNDLTSNFQRGDQVEVEYIKLPL